MKNAIAACFAGLLLFSTGSYAQYLPTLPSVCTVAPAVAPNGPHQLAFPNAPTGERIIDARPGAINAAKGRAQFANKGKVSIVNMNPFLYDYRVQVAQTEIVDTSLVKFLKLLSPLFGEAGVLEAKRLEAASQAIEYSAATMRLLLTKFSPPPVCDVANAGCIALKDLDEIALSISQTLHDPAAITSLDAGPAAFPAGANTDCLMQLNARIEDGEVDTTALIQAANTYYWFYSRVVRPDLTKLRGSLVSLKGLNKLLKSRDDAYQAAKRFDALTEAQLRYLFSVRDFNSQVKALTDEYDAKLEKLQQTETAFKERAQQIELLKGREGEAFQRDLTIERRYEASRVKITVSPTAKKPLGAENARGDSPNPKAGDNQPVGNGGAGNGGNAGNLGQAANPGALGREARRLRGRAEADPAPTPKPDDMAAKDIADEVQIGRPRFALSGGLVYAKLPQQKYGGVLGLARDSQGAATGTALTNIIGLTENSPRRVQPMLLLNTRLTAFRSANLYFSVGLTAKSTNGKFNTEYLLGPSVGFLNDRVFITAGAYAGKQQRLLADLYNGASLENISTLALTRDSYIWKPGLAISYNLFKRKGEAAGAGKTKPSSGGREDEIVLGRLPFSLAAGFAFVPLERQEFGEVAGLARDRQGALTNGQQLTKIVGMTENSRRRLQPLAMLHTRLTDFSRYNVYFSLGLTAKTGDSQPPLEYLLGPSLNLGNNLFLTFGAYAGKQNRLAGDLFLGAKLTDSQSVITRTEYHWRPALAFTYNFTNLLRPGAGDPK